MHTPENKSYDIDPSVDHHNAFGIDPGRIGREEPKRFPGGIELPDGSRVYDDGENFLATEENLNMLVDRISKREAKTAWRAAALCSGALSMAATTVMYINGNESQGIAPYELEPSVTHGLVFYLGSGIVSGILAAVHNHQQKLRNREDWKRFFHAHLTTEANE